MNNIAVVYTLWENLKKTSDMEVGQVGFHSNKEVIIYFFVMISHTVFSQLNAGPRLIPGFI